MMFKIRRYCASRGGVLASIILVAIFTLYEVYTIRNVQRELLNLRLAIETGDSLYLIDTPGCKIPNMKAWSPEAMEHVFDVPHVDCGRPPLVESNDTHLLIIDRVFPQYGITNGQNFACCFRPVWRNIPNVTVDVDGNINNESLIDNVVHDYDVRYSAHCHPFFGSAEIRYEFVQVECKIYDGRDVVSVYKDYHAFFPGLTKSKIKKEQNLHEPKLNVLFIGVDSLSRLNMIRKMPKTFTYITETLKGIPMYGYSKIGLNTFPNLMPLFTGLTIDDMEKKCWPHQMAHLDPCPWIWKSFSSRGYTTAYMEDCPNMNTFNLQKTGFIFQPTDHYGSTLFAAAYVEKYIDGICMGPRNQIEVLLNFTSKYLKAMRRSGKKFFSFSWGVALSHDSVNDVGDADALYFNLLREIEMDGMLNDTFLFFISDHGLRFGNFLRTSQAQLEGSLPALFLIIPEWFQKHFSAALKNVRHNQHRLLTTLDLHATISDLLDQNSLKSETILRRTRENKLKAPVSLFLPIAENRTCEEARIPAEFCACQHFHKTPLNQPIIHQVAAFVVTSINHQVQKYNDCIPLVLTKVHLAECGPPFYKVEERSENIIEYQVSFYTSPSNAFYMALVRHSTADQIFQLVGEVSRLNAYGNQSDCMPVYKLRPFCYCRTSPNPKQTNLLVD